MEMQSVQFILHILFFGNIFLGVTGYPSGSVTVACVSMSPQHGSSTPATGPAPYAIKTKNSNDGKGQTITVTLEGIGAHFKGFLLQAMNNVTGERPVGTFTLVGDSSQLLDCGGAGSAVSHKNSMEKSSVEVMWKAPDIANATIEFRATVVQQLTTYWVGLRSDPVAYDGKPYNSAPSMSFTLSVLLLLLLPILT